MDGPLEARSGGVGELRLDAGRGAAAEQLDADLLRRRRGGGEQEGENGAHGRRA
jgi:hypothetical protein